MARSPLLLLSLAAAATAQASQVAPVSIGFLATFDEGECVEAWHFLSTACTSVFDVQASPWWRAAGLSGLGLEWLPANDEFTAWKSASAYVLNAGISGPSVAKLPALARVAMLGPALQGHAAPLALLARSSGVPLVSYSASAPGLTPAVDAPSASLTPPLLRMRATHDTEVSAVWAFISDRGWSHVTVLWAAGQGDQAAAALQQIAARDARYSGSGDSEPVSFVGSTSFRTGSTHDVDSVLEAVAEHGARVLVLFAGTRDAALVMQRADALRMMGKGWTWLGGDWVRELTWATAEVAGGEGGAGGSTQSHRVLAEGSRAAPRALAGDVASRVPTSARAAVLRAMQGAVGVVPAFPGNNGNAIRAASTSALPRFTLETLQKTNFSACILRVPGAAPLPPPSSCPGLSLPALASGGGGVPMDGEAGLVYDATWVTASAAADAWAGAKAASLRAPATLAAPAVASLLSLNGSSRVAPRTGLPVGGARWLRNGDREAPALALVNVQGEDVVHVGMWVPSTVQADPAAGVSPWSGDWALSSPVVWPGGSTVTPPDRADLSDTAGSTALLIGLLGMAASLAFGAVLHKSGVEWLPESGATVLMGVVLGLVVRVGASEEVKANAGFNTEVFMLILLPIIIFESGYSLQQRAFFTQLFSIFTFAVAGTVISALTIGGLLYYAGQRGVVFPLSWEECMAFASLLSATDPVATLAVFGALNVDPTLNSLVYGESVLNDAVGLAAYGAFTSFLVNEVTQVRAAYALARFVALLTVSVLVGGGVALFATFIFRLLHVPATLEDASEVLSPSHRPRAGTPSHRHATPMEEGAAGGGGGRRTDLGVVGVVATSEQPPSRVTFSTPPKASRRSSLIPRTVSVKKVALAAGAVRRALRSVAAATGLTLTGRGHASEESAAGVEGGAEDPFAGIGETAFLLLFCYISFAAAEVVYLSGIVSSLFAGVTMARFTRVIMTDGGRRVSAATFKMLATLADTAVFLQIGLNVVLLWGKGTYDFSFICLALFGCLLGRALNIFPLSAILNIGRKEKIGLNMQVQMWHAGLRGAIAFASALTFPTQNRQKIVNATSWICLFTIGAMGTTTTTALKGLKIPYGPAAALKRARGTANLQDELATSPVKRALAWMDGVLRRLVYGSTLLPLIEALEAEAAGARSGAGGQGAASVEAGVAADSPVPFVLAPLNEEKGGRRRGAGQDEGQGEGQRVQLRLAMAGGSEADVRSLGTTRLASDWMQQLTKEEAGRVTSILQDSVKRLKLLSRVPLPSREVIALAETASELGLLELADELAQVAQLEAEYRDAVKHAKQKAGHEHVDDAVLRATHKRLAHALRANGKAADVLPLEAHVPRSAARPEPPGEEDAGASSSHGKHRSGGAAHMSGFIECLLTLIEFSARKLVTTRDAARDEQVEMGNKLGRIDNAEREVALLQDELRRQRAARSKQSSDLEESLSSVKAELVSVAKAAEQELKTLHGQGTQRTADLDAGHGKVQASLQEQLVKLQAEYKAACDAHVDAEAGVRKRKVRARAEVEAAVAEHDAAVAVAIAAVEEVRRSITVEVEPIVDLRAYYEKIDAELARVAEEARIERDRIWLEDEVPKFRQRISARKIQKVYLRWKEKQDYLRKQKANKKG